jgi:hypothetical protein
MSLLARDGRVVREVQHDIRVPGIGGELSIVRQCLERRWIVVELRRGGRHVPVCEAASIDAYCPGHELPSAERGHRAGVEKRVDGHLNDLVRARDTCDAQRQHRRR